jgi:hypothetical protein
VAVIALVPTLALAALAALGGLPLGRDDGPAPAGPAEACVWAAERMYEQKSDNFFHDRPGSAVYVPSWWSARWLAADLYRARDDAERRAAARRHVERMRDVLRHALRRVATGRVPESYGFAADFYLADAEVRAAQADGASDRAAARRRADSAHKAYEADLGLMTELDASPVSYLWSALKWSHHWRDAELAVQETEAGRLAAARACLQRDRTLEQMARRASAETPDELLRHQAAFYRSDAEAVVAALEGNGGRPAREEAARVRLDAAQAAYEILWGQHRDIDHLYQWSNHWRRAAEAVAHSKAAVVAALEAHRGRMAAVQQRVKDHGGLAVPVWQNATTFYRSEADVLLAKAQAR